MAEPAQPPLSGAASPFAPQNTPEKSDNPPPPSHPLPPLVSIAAHAARRGTVPDGWYAWNGEDLPPRSGGRGGGRGGGAARSARELVDERGIGDQREPQRRDGTGQGFWRWFNNSRGSNFTQPTSPARVPQPNNNNSQDGLDGVVYRPEAAHHDSDSSSPMTRIMRREQNAATVRRTAVGARVAAMVFSLVALSVLAADRNKGWALDSYSNYSQFRYCETVNVIGFVYAGFQLYALMHHKKTQKHIIQRPLGDYFDFVMDQVLAYLLISASSSATARVSDWIVNWGTDPFPDMANGSIAVTFLAFLAFAVSSLLSAYNLFSKTF